jgi:hypothetical protein
VRARGEQLRPLLNDTFVSSSHVGDIFELVRDRASKAPFDSSLKINARVKADAFKRGLMVYPMGGTLDGTRGDHIPGDGQTPSMSHRPLNSRVPLV